MITRNDIKLFGFVLFAVLLCIVNNGCFKTVILHPISKSDIFDIEQGAVITHKNGKQEVIEKQGKFLSEYTLQEIIKARAE